MRLRTLDLIVDIDGHGLKLFGFFTSLKGSPPLVSLAIFGRGSLGPDGINSGYEKVSYFRLQGGLNFESC